MSDDLDDEIRELAIQIEKQIQENAEFLEQLPDFEPRLMADAHVPVADMVGQSQHNTSTDIFDNDGS